MADNRINSKVQIAVVGLGLILVAFVIGFGLARWRDDAQTKRLFSLISSENVGQQACAEVAIKNDQPYNNEFIDWCINRMAKIQVKQ